MTPRAKPLRFLRRSWDTAVVALAAATLLAMSMSLSRIAGWIPRIVLVITLALVIVQLVVEFRELGPAQDGTPPTRVRPMRPTGPVVVVMWIAGLMLAILCFGTVVGSSLFCAAYLRWHAHEPWPTSAFIAVSLGTCVQLIFGLLLHAQLRTGWLWRLLH